jgi:hypothetical protein
MIRRVKIRVSMILLPLLAAGAVAQDVAPEDVPAEVRRYTVEMIIFSYEQNVSAGSEIFIPDEPPPLELIEEGDLLDGSLPDGAMPDEAVAIEEPELDELELVDEDKKYELVMLPEEDFILLDVIERLDNLDAYAPLMHFGWTQPTYPQEETETRPLSSFSTPPDGLEGDLTLYLSRYLHLAVNLQLDAAAAEETEEALALDNFSSSYDDFGDDAAVTYPVRYRIEEDRIFRSGELRYYDHPKFGVLAKITRVEEEEPEEFEEEFEEELLGYDGE